MAARAYSATRSSCGSARGSAGKNGHRNGRRKKEVFHHGRRHPSINEWARQRRHQHGNQWGDKVTELLCAHQKKRILRLRLASGSDFFAKATGVFAVHDLIDRRRNGFTAGEISEHRCPCDALQKSEVSTNGKKQRHPHHRASDDTDGAKVGQHGALFYEKQIRRQAYP